MVMARSRPLAARPDVTPLAEIAESVLTSGLLTLCAVAEGRVVFRTPGFDRLFGDAGSRPCRFLDFAAPHERERVDAVLRSATGEVATPLLFEGICLDGRSCTLQASFTRAKGAQPGVVFVSLHDVTRWTESTERFRSMALHDPLTELPNRLLFNDRAKKALAPTGVDTRACLMLLDLDGFKQVNDVHGHAAGDAVLRNVARRLRACFREDDTVARLGGDEFAVVLPEIQSREIAAVTAARVVRALGEPFRQDGVALSIGASVGIALAPEDGDSVAGLLESVDAAMYAAKTAGKRRFVFATQSARAVRARSFVSWGVECQLGVPEMDGEHEALFVALSGLDDDLRQPALRSVAAAVAEHFASEEALMARAGVPGLDAHREEHRRLLEDLDLLIEHAAQLAGPIVKRFLHTWLLGHLRTYDRAVARALLRRA